jgi:hypothetical protein
VTDVNGTARTQSDGTGDGGIVSTAIGTEDGASFYLRHPSGKLVADPAKYLVIVEDAAEARKFSKAEIDSWSVDKLNSFAKEGYRFIKVEEL